MRDRSRPSRRSAYSGQEAIFCKIESIAVWFASLMPEIRQPTPDLLVIDLHPRWYFTIPPLAVGTVLFWLHPFYVFGVSMFAILATVLFAVLVTRRSIEFNRTLKTATWRRRYLIELPPEVYDLTRFEGICVEDLPNKSYCVTIAAPTVSVMVLEFPERNKDAALLLARELAEFTTLKIVSLPPRRSQFHLATALILMVVAGGLVGLGVQHLKSFEEWVILSAISMACLLHLGKYVEHFFRRRELRSGQTPVAKEEKTSL
jgi:hypothetical protein